MGSARTPLGPICSFLPLNHMCNFVAQNSQKYARIDFYFIEIIPPCDFSLVLTFVHSNLCPDTVRRTKTKSKTKNITIMQICIWINMSRWFLKTSTFILNQVLNNMNNITDWFQYSLGEYVYNKARYFSVRLEFWSALASAPSWNLSCG